MCLSRRTKDSIIKMAHIEDSHIANTEWPETPVPEAAKRLIDLFLDIMDHNTEDAGDRLATEIFAPDGELRTSAAISSGEAGWFAFSNHVFSPLSILNLYFTTGFGIMLKSVSSQDE